MGELTIEEMRQKLSEQERLKRKACVGELQAVLEKHGYMLVGTPIIVEGRIQTRLDLVPIEEQR